MLSFKSFILESWFEKNDNTHLRRRSTIQDQIGRPTPSKEETGAIKRYVKNSKPVNKVLISGTSEHPDIKHLDSYLEKNKLPVDLHAYSAVDYNPKDKLNDEKELSLPAYMSVTPHKDVAKGYTSPDKNGIHHIIHVMLKKGDTAAPLGTHEDEVLIGRGQTMNYHGSVDFEDGDKKYRIHKMSIK